jgi:NAD+ synthetase
VCTPFTHNNIVVADLDGAGVDYPFGDDIDDLGISLVTSLRDYVNKGNIKGVVLGLSGGIDSAVCAALATLALGSERVIGIRMPSQYSSQGSLDDAAVLAHNLGIRCDTVKIAELYGLYETSLSGLIGFGTARYPGDVTEENVQARIRGNIVMAYTNKFGMIGIATGNKSEFSVGYSTLYGDMAGGFALIKDVFKLDVYRLAEWLNTKGSMIPQSSITKPPSAELRPDQKDSDSLPDYGLLDPLLKKYIECSWGQQELVKAGFDPVVVNKVIAMTDRAEYKRRQAPPGPIVSAEGLAWLNRQYPMTTRFTP